MKMDLVEYLDFVKKKCSGIAASNFAVAILQMRIATFQPV